MPYPEPLNLTTLFLCHLQKVTEVRFIKKDVNCNPSSRCLHDFSKNIHICKHIHNNGNDLDQTGKTQIIVLYKLTYRILHWSWANTLIFFKHYNVLFSMLFHLTWRLSRALDLPFEKWSDHLCDNGHKYQSPAKCCVMGCLGFVWNQVDFAPNRWYHAVAGI